MKSIVSIKEKFEIEKTVLFSQQEAQQWQDILSLMENKALIKNCSTLSGTQYAILGDFRIFEDWVSLENKKAKRISKREWKIAIIAAVIGAVIGLLPTIIPIIMQWLKYMFNAT
ncbi:MAG: hypothetical protein J5826_08280 [Bacteroidales bacterium]|nr:hypothetical protein [Bacteroidales bacterium]